MPEQKIGLVFMYIDDSSTYIDYISFCVDCVYAKDNAITQVLISSSLSERIVDLLATSCAATIHETIAHYHTLMVLFCSLSPLSVSMALRALSALR